LGNDVSGTCCCAGDLGTLPRSCVGYTEESGGVYGVPRDHHGGADLHSGGGGGEETHWCKGCEDYEEALEGHFPFLVSLARTKCPDANTNQTDLDESITYSRELEFTIFFPALSIQTCFLDST